MKASIKLLLFVFFIFAFSGCLTVAKIERNCDKFAKVCISDSQTEIVYRDTIIYRTDTITIHLPADTVKLTDTVRIINGRAYLHPVYKEFGMVWASAQVKNNVLDLQAGLTKSNLQNVIHDTITIEKAIKEQTRTNTVVLPPEKYVPKFYKILLLGNIILIALAGLFVFVKSKTIQFSGIKKLINGLK